MNNREFVSRVSNQVRLINKDDYISDRFVLSIGKSIANKFITQKIQRRSLDRDLSLYKLIECIEFEKVNVFKCNYVEFKSCNKLSKSKNKFSNLTFTRYGSTIKELFTIDRTKSFSESTLYQLRLNNDRSTENNVDKFYLLDDYIYIPSHIKTLSALVLSLDQYELDELCNCKDNCESAWEKEFICPSSLLEDCISLTIQNLLQTKSIQPDEKPDLSENIKQ